MDHQLNFNQHISAVISKVRGALGFIKRWAKEFSDPYTNTALYILFVRPILEYCSVVWNPHSMTNIDAIESVQKQFFLFALRGLPWTSNYNLPQCEHRLNLIQLPTLMKRRTITNILFVFKLFNNVVDSSHLTSLLNLNIPDRRVRHYTFIK